MRLVPQYFLLGIAMALGVAASAYADVVLSAGAATAPPNGVVDVPVNFADASDAPTIVILHLAFDPSLVTPRGGKLVGPDIDASKAFDWNVVGSTLYVIAYSLSGSYTSQDSIDLYFRVAPTAPAGDIPLAFSSGSATNQGQQDLPLSFSGATITVAPVSGLHSADYDHDWTINLSEVLRIIQFYNFGGLQCGTGTEDGYAPGVGDESCNPHDSDYNPQDWKISLSELLRVIQFYNLGSYHPDGAGEDGFAPGPF